MAAEDPVKRRWIFGSHLGVIYNQLERDSLVPSTTRDQRIGVLQRFFPSNLEKSLETSVGDFGCGTRIAISIAAVFSNLSCHCVFIKLIFIRFCMSAYMYMIIGERSKVTAMRNLLENTVERAEIVSEYSTKYRQPWERDDRVHIIIAV